MEAKQLKPGDVLGRYQLVLPIAKGGMGQVWAARLTGTRGFQKLVAVKTILCPADDSGGELEAMLFEEASLASQIRHPNVAQTLDLGEQDGALYLVMEWVDGEPLDFVMRTARAVGGVPIAIAAHLIVQACKGLHAAHEAKDSNGQPLGIVHRDVSPQNLLVSYSGVVKLVDFGVAKATHQVSQPTALGMLKGKFAYMSPEQVQGEALDGRSDIFGMGIVLYRLTTGQHPFKADNAAATIRNILIKSPAPPSEIVSGFPASLEAVVMKALAREKNERFASAHEMMAALERALPAPVSAHGERNTEIFLHRLFQKRITERNEALQEGMKAADRASGVMMAPALGLRLPRSQSTMRGVSLDAGVDSSPSISPASQITAAAAPAPPRWRWPAFALAASVSLALGFLMVGERAPKANSAPGLGEGPTLPAPLVTAVQDRARAASDKEPVAPSSSASSSASDSQVLVPRPSSSAIDSELLAPSSSAAAPSGASGSVAGGATPPQKRDRPMRRDGIAGAPQTARPASSTPLPSPPSASGDVDPLNRRK